MIPGKGRFRRFGDEPRTPTRHTGEINVTPLVDVLLVLLVIFMAALGLTQKGLDVTVPREVRPPSQPAVDSIVVEVGEDGRISVNHQDVLVWDLEYRLRQIFKARDDKTLFIMGAGSRRYGEIVAIVDAAKGAGVTRVGIVTESMRASG
jgi:biopolymer transport protein ExbD